MKKIFVTGGHYTPAKAVVEKLLQKDDLKIFYIGRKTSLEGDKALSMEFLEMRERKDLTFLEITTGRLQRNFTKNTIPSLFKIPIGFAQSFWWSMKFNPDIIITFGGYVGVPVAISGWLLGIPVVTHEQTRVASLSSKLISPFVKKIFVSWPEMLKNYPKEKVVLTGNPVGKDVFEINKTEDYLKFLEVKKKTKLPTIYITGGNQGSHSINVLIEEILPNLLKNYMVIHQCGGSEEYDDFKTLRKYDSNRYFLFKSIDRKNIGWVFKESDLVIGRSGANTVSEIGILGKPSILIPLPWSGGGEALKNAEVLVSFGGSKILTQETLTSKQLLGEIQEIMANIQNFRVKSEKAKEVYISDAANNIGCEIESILNEKKD